MRKIKPRFDEETSKTLQEIILSASIAHVAPKIINEARIYFASENSLLDHYRYFDEISRTSLRKVCPSIRIACDVKKYYRSPKDIKESFT